MILATGLTRAINHRMIDAFQMRHRCRFFGIGLTALLHQSGKRFIAETDLTHPAIEPHAAGHLPEHGWQAQLFIHLATGAQVLSVRNADPNNTFAISFETYPQDATGVAHILEHMVFRGSRNYPLSRPFSALLQSSLRSYLSASTQPDVTIFHLASLNQADFGNLIDVTMDAVLRPRLGPTAFGDEAWHIALDSIDAVPRLGGIVLAEMAGHLVVPLNALRDGLRRALYPGSVYAHVHGGDPARIPDLNHAALVAFHRRHYHPSNARLFLWGDGVLLPRLDQIDRHFHGFQRRVPLAPLVEISRFAAPVRTGSSYECHPAPRAGWVGMGWVLAADHPCDLGPLGWPFLAFALGGMAQSPLTAALRESGRCQRVLPDGLDADLHPRMFSICAEGVDPDDVQMVESTLLAVLNQLASTGFSPQFLQAALNAFTFRLSETAPGLRPQGLNVLDRILPDWRHGGDPVAALAQVKALAQLAAGVADRQNLLQSMIRRELLENQHRATCSLHASATWAAPPNAARIAGIAQDLTPSDRRDLAIATANRQQPAVETAGALLSLPFLQRSELPSQISRIRAEAAANVVSITLSDPGIRRVDLALDLTGAARDLAGYAPLLGRLLVEAASDLPLTARTGGISAICWAGAGFGCPDAARLILRGKALQANGSDLVAVLADTMTRAAVVDPVALMRLVREEIARQQARLLSAGHQVSELRLRARTGLAGSFADLLDGLGQLAFLQQTAARLASEPELVLGELAQLRAAVLTQDNVLIGVSAGLDAGPLLQALPVRPEMTPRPVHAVAIGTLREGHRIVSPVSAVGLGADLRAAGLNLTGAARVGLQAQATGWLWDAVRVAGGAYGVRVILDAATGVATFLSFRDPHILRTLQAFGQSGSQLRASATEALVQRCIIGAIAETTRPHAPDAQALLVLQRQLTGHTDALRKAEHDAILGATPTDFLDLAAALDHALPQGPVVVLGPQAALLSALAAEPGLFVIRA